MSKTVNELKQELEALTPKKKEQEVEQYHPRLLEQWERYKAAKPNHGTFEEYAATAILIDDAMREMLGDAYVPFGTADEIKAKMRPSL